MSWEQTQGTYNGKEASGWARGLYPGKTPIVIARTKRVLLTIRSKLLLALDEVRLKLKLELCRLQPLSGCSIQGRGGFCPRGFHELQMTIILL